MAAGFDSRKSSTGSTMPRPMRWNQTRLATDLAKNSLPGLVSQSAKAARRSVPAGTSWSPANGKRGFITLLVRGWLTSPARRLRMTSADVAASLGSTPAAGLRPTRANTAARP